MTPPSPEPPPIDHRPPRAAALGSLSEPSSPLLGSPTPLPEPLPEDPLPLVGEWLAEAQQRSRGAASMALATVDPDGRPSVRMVICRGFDARAGWLVFYTDRDSRKGRAPAARSRAALVFTGRRSSDRSRRGPGDPRPMPIRPLLEHAPARRASLPSPAKQSRPVAAGVPRPDRGGARQARPRARATAALGGLSRVGRGGRAVGESAGARARPRGVDARARAVRRRL